MIIMCTVMIRRIRFKEYNVCCFATRRKFKNYFVSNALKSTPHVHQRSGMWLVDITFRDYALLNNFTIENYRMRVVKNEMIYNNRDTQKVFFFYTVYLDITSSVP